MWTNTMHRNRMRNCNSFRDCRTDQDINKSIPTNIQKSKEEIVLLMSLPAYDRSEIEIKLENNELIISTNPKEDSSKFNHQEFKKTTLRRVFRIPQSVIMDEIQAKFEAGILKVTLKKVQTEKTNINII
ncbi:MAG: Hsp20/alpha crystallin family protein [Saprospiraceae bacterium]